MRTVLLLPIALLAITASAQVVAPAPVLGLSGLDCSAGAVANHLSVPESPEVPSLRLGLSIATPMPNVCAESSMLTVLPEGAQFRLDPLPPSANDDPGRQLLREQRLERRFQSLRYLDDLHEIQVDALRQQVGYPAFEPLHLAPLVAPSGERP